MSVTAKEVIAAIEGVTINEATQALIFVTKGKEIISSVVGMDGDSLLPILKEHYNDQKKAESLIQGNGDIRTITDKAVDYKKGSTSYLAPHKDAKQAKEWKSINDIDYAYLWDGKKWANF